MWRISFWSRWASTTATAEGGERVIGQADLTDVGAHAAVGIVRADLGEGHGTGRRPARNRRVRVLFAQGSAEDRRGSDLNVR
jgi:hypothetical protein